MKTSQKGIDLIKAYEGYSATPYVCPAGYLTIGYGHLIKKGESFKKVTKDQAEDLLRNDLTTAESAVTRLINYRINQNQFDSLVSFVYNLGAGALQASTLRRKINRGDVAEAAEEFKKWVFAGGKKLKGLIRRRKAEEDLYRGIYG